jgi:hypothetical protein
LKKNVPKIGVSLQSSAPGGGIFLPRPKKEARDFRSEVISGPEAAILLGISERSFYYLVEEGVIPKIGDGKYVLGDIEEAYWKNSFNSEGLEAAQTRLTTAKAELAELELAEHRGEVHRASAVMRVWADNVMNTKTRLLAIPTKISPELVGKNIQEIQAKLKEAISEALQELSDYDERRIARAAASFRE